MLLLRFSFLAVFFWFFSAQAVLVNVTIDDTTGDSLTGALVSYTPPDAWNSCNKASSCAVDLDTTQLENRTSHDSTFSVDGGAHPNVPLSATVSFNGTSVFVFCAIPRSSTNPDGSVDLAFSIDGVVVGKFEKPALGSAGVAYKVPVYTNTALRPGRHTLTVQNGRPDGSTSLMILDSIVYSYDDGTTAPSTAPSASASSTPSATHGPSPTTLAVAGVLTFALVLLLVILAIFLYRRRRRRRAVYAQYMPKGAVRAFPADLAPSPISPAMISPLPPVYAGQGGGNSGGNWWVGRDQKTRDGPRGTHRPYMDLDPTQGGLQRPQPWERVTPRPHY